MFLKAASKCFGEYEEKETKLRRKHTKMIKEFEGRLEEDKKTRTDKIKNESFKLLSNVYMEREDLINKIEILTIELEALDLPKGVINDIIEDVQNTFFDFYY